MVCVSWRLRQPFVCKAGLNSSENAAIPTMQTASNSMPSPELRLTCHVLPHSLQDAHDLKLVCQPQHSRQAFLRRFQVGLLHLVRVVAEAQEQRRLLRSAACQWLFQYKLAVLQVQQQSTYISW